MLSILFALASATTCEIATSFAVVLEVRLPDPANIKRRKSSKKPHKIKSFQVN